MTLDTRDAHRLYVKVNQLTGTLHEDEVMDAGEANRRNDELDSEGSEVRWMVCAERSGDSVAA